MITLTIRNIHQTGTQITAFETKAQALAAKDQIVAGMMHATALAETYTTRERDHGFEWTAGSFVLRMVDLDEAVDAIIEAFGLIDPARRDSESTPTSAAAFIRDYCAREYGIDGELVDEVIPTFVPMGCDDHFPDTCAECGSI